MNGNVLSSRYRIICVLGVVMAAVVSLSSAERVAVTEGKCLRFDGADDVVNAGDVAAIDSAQQLTAEMWVRIDTFTAWRTFFGKFRNLANRIQFQEYSEPGKIALVVNNGADIAREGNQAYYYTPSPEVTIGNWFHLAMVFDGTLPEEQRMKLYINGMARTLKKEAAARGAVPDRLPATTAPLLLGAEKKNGEYGYRGLMDEIRIWTVARSGQQIRDNMEHELSGAEEGLQLYFAVDARSAEAKRLVDCAPGKHDGALVNFDSVRCFVDRDVAVPSTAASNLAATELSPGCVRIDWVRGSGSANCVFATEGDTGFPRPEAGSTYAADTMFGRGAPIGTTQWFCVYNGYDGGTPVAGLKPSRNYRIAVVDYNGSAGHERYKTGSTLSVINVTPVVVPDKKQQEIEFVLPDTVVADQKFIVLDAKAHSGLPLSYRTDNASVAEIVNDTLRIVGPGEVTVTASQEGDDGWAQAPEVSLVLCVKSKDVVPVPQTAVSHGTGNSFGKLKPWLIAGGAVIVTGTVALFVLTEIKSDDGSSPMVDRPPGDPVMGAVQP